MAEKEYKQRVDEFEELLQGCIILSQKCEGIASPTGAHFYASVLFTLLCSRSVSFALLIPESEWSNKNVEHWDYASLATLARTILEIRLSFHYLCIEECSADEWQCRLNIFNLHDCAARIDLFTKMDPQSGDIPGFESQAEELRDRLNNNQHFLSLKSSEQKKYLHGKGAYLYPLENIAESAGIDIPTFRWVYKYFSSHVHGLPLSFYRAGITDSRGNGCHSKVEEDKSRLCVIFVAAMLSASLEDMSELFSDHLQSLSTDK